MHDQGGSDWFQQTGFSKAGSARRGRTNEQEGPRTYLDKGLVCHLGTEAAQPRTGLPRLEAWCVGVFAPDWTQLSNPLAVSDM